MGKIFNGEYVRLDDDASFQLARTNPLLTTNVKLMYDGESMNLESYDANPLLGTMKYKNFKVYGNSPYNRDMRNFLLGTGDSAYDIFQKESDYSVCDSFDKQFETMYWCGAESINSRMYDQELGFMAPLYIRRKLPRYFVIFKVDGPSSFNLTVIDGKTVDSEFDIDTDIMENARIIKTFDLSEGTPIGNYIKRYVEQTDFEYDRSVHVNFSTNEITYYGIDKKYGVLTSKVENFETALLENDNTVMHSDDWITCGFKRNGLIFPYILNIEFLFDDDDTPDFRFARYFGMYCNDIDLFEFEASCKGFGRPEDIVRETIVVRKDDDHPIELAFTDPDLGEYGIVGNSFVYVKDKNGVLHQVLEISDGDGSDSDSDSDGGMSLKMADKTLDLETVCGFETESVSAKCERAGMWGKDVFSFTFRKNPKQAESIYVKKDGEVVGTFTAVTNLDENPIKPGLYVGTKFSAEGPVETVAEAFCACVNSLEDEGFPFKASHDGGTVLLSYLENGPAEGYEIVPENSLIINNRVSINGDGSVGGYCPDGKRVFKIDSDDRVMFRPGRYLKSGNDNRLNAEILNRSPYSDRYGDIVPGVYGVSTDENGVFVTISNTGQAEIIDRFFPKFGILSFFPVKDFDFDLLFSSYGTYRAFRKECEALEEKSGVNGSGSDSDGYTRGDITSLATGYIIDEEGRPLDSEYEYFMENLIPEMTVQSKTVPYITKWGYYDDSKDSCENTYRLNMSKIFGTSNLSSNTFASEYSISEHTHSMPYYLKPKRKDGEGEEETGDGLNYQYVYDNIGIYSEDDSDEFDYNDFSKHCMEVFSDKDNDVFDKLFYSKTGTNKRFLRKYSRLDFGSSDRFPETLFRGVKFDVRKIVENEERPGSDYNGYKFSFLYIPVEPDVVCTSNTVYFVKNDKFKFIIGFVLVNVLTKGYSVGGEEPDYTYDISDFSKAYMYGGCYGLLSMPLVQGSDTIDRITFKDIPIGDFMHMNGKVNKDGFVNFSKMNVTNRTVKTILENIDTEDCVYSIRFHTTEKWITLFKKKLKYSDGVITYNDFIESESEHVSENSLVDITIVDNTGNSDMESLIFRDFYGVFDSFSTSGIKENIENGNVVFYSKGGDEYSVHIEDPVSFNTYDIFTISPQIVTNSGVSSVCASDISLKNDINDISLKTINRYSGFYNPIFTDILMFEDMDGNPFSNTVFDTDYEDDYGRFGLIRNLWFHKVNEKDSDRIVTMTPPLYPGIGQFCLDCRDYGMFESNWDDGYFTEQMDLTTAERRPGTAGTLNTVSMFGSKYVHVPNEVTIDTFDGLLDWNDDLISDPMNSDADVMFKEINGNTVSFYLFLKKRIIRWFSEESGLKEEFVNFINPHYSYGDKTSVDDDIEAYIERNILKLYELKEINLWIRDTKKGIHDSRIENDYSTYLPLDDKGKERKRMRNVKTFSMRKMTDDPFDRCLTYNLKTGHKEDFGFSFTIRKI